jgi:hypothetical protein
MTEKCRQCLTVLGKLVKPHTTESCPLIKSSYCGLCASYGHTQMGCPDLLTQAFREPQYLEQLVAPSLLEQYGITSRTIIPSCPITAVKGEHLMEIPETEDALRAALVAAGVKPMICQEKGKKENKELIENKKRLQRVADKLGRKLIFITDSSKKLGVK